MATSIAIKVRHDVEVASSDADQSYLTLDNQDQLRAYVHEIARIAAGDVHLSDMVSRIDHPDSRSGEGNQVNALPTI